MIVKSHCVKEIRVKIRTPPTRLHQIVLSPIVRQASIMSTPGRSTGQQQQPASGVRSSSPLAFPTSSPRGGGPAPASASRQQQQAQTNGQNGMNVPNGLNNARSSSPLLFPSSSPGKAGPAGDPGPANGAANTPRAGQRVAPLFAPASATRSVANGGRAGSHPSSEPLFFPSSATPKTRRTRGDIHSALPNSPSPLRRQQRDGTAAANGGGAPSSSGIEGRGGVPSSNAGGRLGAPPSLSNVGPSSDALEEQDRNQGARTVIWNTAVGLDETMSSFKGFLQDFKAKYRTEYARKQGKPESYTPSSNPEKLVYEQ